MAVVRISEETRQCLLESPLESLSEEGYKTFPLLHFLPVNMVMSQQTNGQFLILTLRLRQFDVTRQLSKFAILFSRSLPTPYVQSVTIS